MRTTVNPGSLLTCEGSFDVHPDHGTLRDRESGHEITLAGLMSSFLEDPQETVTGPIRISIMAVPVSRPVPDYDPLIDYPERFTDGPI